MASLTLLRSILASLSEKDVKAGDELVQQVKIFTKPLYKTSVMSRKRCVGGFAAFDKGHMRG
jgi:hypothetical protein